MSKHEVTITCDVCNQPVATEVGTIFKKVDVITPFLEVPYHYIALDEWDLPVSEKGSKHICITCMQPIYNMAGVGKGVKGIVKMEGR